MQKKITLALIVIILIVIGVIVWLLPTKPKPVIETPPVSPAETNPSCFDSSKDPIPICNCDDLQKMAQDLTANYELRNDIDCSDTKNWNDGKGFDPIAYDTDFATSGFQGTPFSGTFNGQNHKIKNLFINRPNEDFIGLFGYVSGGEINNVGLENINISGRDNTGGLIGKNYNATTSNSYATGYITGKDDIGGLVGSNKGNSTITDSYAAVKVFNSDSNVGGLVGENEGLITNCYATGDVSGNTDTGGLVGESNGIDDEGNLHIGTISNCYTTGNVVGNENVGGLLANTHQGIVMNSYAIGTVSGNKDIGGFIGDNHNGEIKDSFSTGEVKGNKRVGGFAGTNHGGKITNCYWNKGVGVSLDCVGENKEKGIVNCQTINNNESYFYLFNNPPMNVWKLPPWSSQNDGKDYPVLE